MHYCPACGSRVQYINPLVMAEEGGNPSLCRHLYEVFGGQPHYKCTVCPWMSPQCPTDAEPRVEERYCPRCHAAGWDGDFCYACGYAS
jgi:hypothetical protein